MSLLSLVTPSRRRRAINLRIRPVLQMQLPLTILAITAGFGVLFAKHGQEAYGRLVEIGTEEPWLRELIAQQGHDFLVVSLAIGGAYVLAVMLSCLIFAHRLLGPIIAVRQHLEGMKNGDYSSRIQLRKGDAFTDVANDLNEVCAALREESRKANIA